MSDIDEETIKFSDLTCITSSIRSLELPDERISQETISLKFGLAHVGSVVVCQVQSIGAHEKVESRSGRYVRLNSGDLIMGVLGNRYSTTSMYGGFPESGIDLSSKMSVDLLSSGGVIGNCYTYPSYFKEGPTKLHALGLASQGGKLLEISPRLKDAKLHIPCPLILVAGTSASVGKTKFAAKLIHFLARDLGRQVAATKLAGAGNLDDLLNLKDAGAKYTFDFVDAGLVTTYDVDEKLVVSVAKGVLNQLGKYSPEVIIAELGGDILGANIPAILNDPEIREKTQAIILVPSDVLAAQGALTYLEKIRFPSNEVYVGQPLKNPATSQIRAWDTIDRHLYDCENTEDLARLVEEIPELRGKKELPVQELSAEARASFQTTATP